MRRLNLLIVILFVLTSSAEALADTASKHAKVRELFQLTYMQSRTEQAKESALAQARAYAAQQLASFALPKKEAQETTDYYQKLYALVATKYDWAKLEPSYEEIYVNLYTEEELDGILAFYKSPVGRALLSKTPEATRQILQVSKEQFDSLAPQIKELTDAYVASLGLQQEPSKPQ